MADYYWRYLSPSGLPDGNDANSGTSSGSAKRTLGAAITAAVAAGGGPHRIIGDGFSVGTDISYGGGSGYIYFNSGSIPALEFVSYTPYSATIAPSSATYGIRFGTSAANIDITFGDIILGGSSIAGGANPTQMIAWQYVAALNGGFTINGMRAVDSGQLWLGLIANALGEFTINDLDFDVGADAFDSVITTNTGMGAGSALYLNRPRIRATNKTGNKNLIDIRGAGAGVIGQVIDPDIVVAHASSTGLNAGVSILNIAKSIVRGGSIEITASAGTAAVAGVIINSDSASYSCDYALVDDVNITVAGNNSGYFARIGQESAGIGSRSGGIIRDCNGVGNSTFLSSGGHGFMLGFATDGVIAGNTATGAAISTLAKGSTDCLIEGNTCREFSNSAVYYKGSTRTRSSDNNIYCDATGGVALKLESDGAGTNTTDCFFQNNNIQLNGAISNIYLATEASQDCIILGNNYYDQSASITQVASITGGVGSPYATFEDFRTAGYDIQPQDIDGAIPRNASSSGGLLQPILGSILG